MFTKNTEDAVYGHSNKITEAVGGLVDGSGADFTLRAVRTGFGQRFGWVCGAASGSNPQLSGLVKLFLLRGDGAVQQE